jgi:hypothetical protein
MRLQNWGIEFDGYLKPIQSVTVTVEEITVTLLPQMGQSLGCYQHLPLSIRT